MSEVLKSSVLERTPDIYFRLDEEGKVLYLNEAWEGWTGISRMEVKGTHLLEHIPPCNKPVFEKVFEELRERKSSWKELVFQLGKNEEDPAPFQVVMQRGREGEGFFIEGTARIKRPEAEKTSENDAAAGTALHERIEGSDRAARLALFPETAPVPLIECDQEGRVRYQNPVAYRLSMEMGKKGQQDFLPSDHESLVQQTLLTGEALYRKTVLGKRTYTWCYCAPPNSKRVHIRGENVTREKEKEAEMLDAVVRTQEGERERFSRELHEGVGQYLSAMLMHFQAMQGELGEDQKERIHHIEGLIQESIRRVRGLSHGLMPRMLKEFGLIPALENLCEQMEELAGIKVEFKDRLDPERLDEKMEVGIYRIALELLEFSAYDRKTDRAYLLLEGYEEGLMLNYGDEGAAQDFPAESLEDLKDFNSRIRSLNGHLEFSDDNKDPKPVRIRIPFS